MKIRSLLSLTLLSTLMLPVAAPARDYGAVAGWQMAASGNSCGLYSAGAGNGQIILLKNLAGQVHVQVTNEFWRSDDGSNIRFAIDGKRWNGPFGIAPTKSKNGAGYIAAFDGLIEKRLRKGKQLAVQRDGLTLGVFSLSGSSAALNRLEFCLNDLRREGPAVVITAAEAAKRQITPPQPKSAVGKWFKFSDYPAAQQRAGNGGTVSFRLTIDVNGKVANCAVTKSSGHAELDASSCKAATKRARFAPAVDGEGKKHVGIFDGKVTWQAPKK